MYVHKEIKMKATAVVTVTQAMNPDPWSWLFLDRVLSALREAMIHIQQ